VCHLPGSNIEYTIAIEDDWANSIYSNGQYALAVSADTINYGNINLPFKIKAYIPAGIDYNYILSNLFVRDRGGVASGFDTNPALTVLVNGYSGQYGIPNFLNNGTTNNITFVFNSSHPRTSYFDDAYMEIQMGNIWKKIPIRLPVPSP
jgi:hypothetical protein